MSIIYINELRNSYNETVNNAKLLCLRWDLPITYIEPCQMYVKKKYFDEVDRDGRLTITEYFKIKVFLLVVDTVLMQFNIYLEAIESVCTTFDFLNLNNPLQLKDIIKEYDFIQTYKDDIL